MADKREFYKNQILKLLPQGRLWEVVPGSTFDKFIEGIAIELSRVDDRALDLLAESNPNSSTELLNEWENLTGLPGDCGDLAETIAERRANVVAKLILTGSQSKNFFASIAQSLGYNVDTSDIIEFQPFVAGSEVGDELTNTEDWAHAFAIETPEYTLRPFRAGTHRAGDRVAEFGDALLECLINDQKPAHSVAIFRYISEAEA